MPQSVLEDPRTAPSRRQIVTPRVSPQHDLSPERESAWIANPGRRRAFLAGLYLTHPVEDTDGFAYYQYHRHLYGLIEARARGDSQPIEVVVPPQKPHTHNYILEHQTLFHQMDLCPLVLADFGSSGDELTALLGHAAVMDKPLIAFSKSDTRETQNAGECLARWDGLVRRTVMYTSPDQAARDIVDAMRAFYAQLEAV